MGVAIKQKIGKIINLIPKMIKAHPLVSAIILCLLYFLMAVFFCDPKYETSDDYYADVILAGGMFGKPNAHLQFSNILLGYFLKCLYSLVPKISFYFVLLELMGLVSLIIVVWLILRHCRVSVGLIVAFVFMSCFSDDIFILVQFTKTASAAVMAGGLLFLEGLFDETIKHKKSVIACGGVLLILGTMLRFNCIYCVVLFLFVSFLLFSINSNARKIISGFLMCTLLLSSSYALSALHKVIWDAEPDYKYYREIDSLRSGLVDFPLPDYSEVKSELDEIGISYVDYDMLDISGFTDLSVFPPDKLERLLDIKEDYYSRHPITFIQVLESLEERAIWIYPGVLGILIIAILYSIYDKKSLLAIIAVLLTSIGLLIAFAFLGRLVYRVEQSILFAACSVLVVSIGRAPRKIAVSNKIQYVLFAVILAAVSIYHLGTYIPDTSYITLDDMAYAEYVDTVFGARGYHHELYSIVVKHRRPHEELLNFIETDEHFFLVDIEALMNVSVNYNPWIRNENGHGVNKSHDIGGCFMMQYPGETYIYEMNGIDPIDPFKSLINDNVYVVDNYFYLDKLEYIRYHYYPDAQIEFIGEKSDCKIWKYYIPEP